MNRQLLFVAVCAVGLGVSAEEIPWSDGTKGGTLSFGADVSGDNSLALPRRHYTNQVAKLSFAAGSGGTLTVDGGEKGYSFGMATNNQEYAYDAYPFNINGAAGSLFSVHRHTLSGVTPATDSQSQIEITNASFRIIRSGTSSALHIDGGVWNAGAPYGEVNANTVRFGNGYGDDQLENLIYVHEGATLDLPHLCFDARARDRNVLCFDGGQHHVRNRICFPSQTLPDDYKTLDRTVQLIVTGPETVLASDMTCSPVSVQHGNSGVYNQDNTDVQIVVTNGATFSVTGLFYPNGKAKRVLLHVVDRANLRISSVAYLAQNYASPCSILVEEGSSAEIGGIYLGSKTTCSVAVTNAALSMGQINVWSDSLLSMKNASVTNSNAYVTSGYVSQEGGNWCITSTSGLQLDSSSTLVSKAGDIWSYGAIVVGSGSSSDATAVLTNGTTALSRTGYTVGNAASSTGRLDIVDRSVATANYYPLKIAAGSGSSGTLNLRSGSVFRHESGAANTTFTTIGVAGDGTLVLDNASYTNHISYVKVAEAAGSRGTLVMTNGAFMRANHIIGGSGTSTLLANGATFVPNEKSGGGSVSSDLISGLTSAKLGADGLTIDSPYAVTVSQAFSNDGEADGLLILAGVGEKKLTGTSSHALTRVVAGSAVLATGTSSIEIAAGAALSLTNGTADAVTYGGLTLGDTDGAGILAVDAADVITTTTAPVFNGVYLALNGTPANGTYPLVQTSATVPAATKTVWTSAYLFAGRQSGKMYSFTVSTASGVTSFNLVVADARALDSKLIKNYNGAGGTVSVSGVEAVDAISFDSTSSYTISGSGAFTLNDTGSGYVKALTGAHELGIGLILPGVTVFDVAEDAELEVSGNIINGAVLKTGFGKLILSGAGNKFLDALTLEKGTLCFEGAAADGSSDASLSNDLILKRGTFEFLGDAAGETLNRTLVIDSGTHTAVVANVKTPLTVKALNMKSGTFIKRGPGTLTYDISAASTKFTCENGNNAYAQPGNVVTFPSTGDMPSKGYIEGYNLAEGAVVIKGASDLLAHLQHYWRLGMNTAEGTVAPSFTVDGLRMYAVGGQTQIGLITSDAFARHFTFALRNGGRFGTDGFYIHGLDDEDGQGSTVCDVLIGDDGWLAVSWAFAMAQQTYATVNIAQTNGGSLYVPGIQFASPFSWSVSGGSIGQSSDRAPSDKATTVSFGYYSKGEVDLVDADFRCVGNLARVTLPNYNAIYSTNAIAFHFDGTTWYPKAGNVDLCMFESETFTLDVTGNGLIISNDASTTFSTRKAFTGDGNIVKAGAGTLVFGKNTTVKGAVFPSQSKVVTSNVLDRTYTMDVTGRLEIREGIVYVADGTIRPDAVITVAEGAVLDLSGATIEVEAIGGRGTVQNGTLKANRILADGSDLHFVNASLPLKNIRLDFERTSENPIDLQGPHVFAHFSDVTSGTYTPRVYGTGYNGSFRGTMTISSDGTASISNILQHGFQLIVR